jgi:hypothetical protein
VISLFYLLLVVIFLSFLIFPFPVVLIPAVFLSQVVFVIIAFFPPFTLSHNIRSAQWTAD